MTSNDRLYAGGALILVLIALVILGPLVTIWALNTLFPVLAIPYTLDTWFAVIVVAGLFKTRVEMNK
jgi:hypothetical protein